MKLFLCSHFSSVGSLIKEEIENKKVAFIPTASLREGYTGYVGSARKLFKKLGAIVTSDKGGHCCKQRINPPLLEPWRTNCGETTKCSMGKRIYRTIE